MSFIWLYLKINISDFWLILLDHTTVEVGIGMKNNSSVNFEMFVF